MSYFYVVDSIDCYMDPPLVNPNYNNQYYMIRQVCPPGTFQMTFQIKFAIILAMGLTLGGLILIYYLKLFGRKTKE